MNINVNSMPISTNKTNYSCPQFKSRHQAVKSITQKSAQPHKNSGLKTCGLIVAGLLGILAVIASDIQAQRKPSQTYKEAATEYAADVRNDVKETIRDYQDEIDEVRYERAKKEGDYERMLKIVDKKCARDCAKAREEGDPGNVLKKIISEM